MYYLYVNSPYIVNLLVFVLKRFFLCEEITIYGELWT